jgi:predicted transport protein
MSEKSEKDKKAFQSYLDNIKAKTGKTPADFRALAKEKGLTKAGEIVAWLKKDFGLGYGHAGAIWQVIGHADDVKASPDDRLAKLFAGNKIKWRKAYDTLEKKVRKFGTDVEVAPNMTYINLCRGSKKFAIVQTTADRLDIGIKLKGIAPTEQFEAAGSWNAMVTHRVRISDPKQIDAEVLAWLRQAYDATKTELREN